MNNLYANNLLVSNNYIYKSYDNLDVNKVKLYYDKLLKYNIKTAKIIEFTQKTDKNTIIKQKFMHNITLEKFVFYDAISSSNLSKKSINIFKKFIKMYFDKIYTLTDISVDCKLSNFIFDKFTLVDIVPALFYEEYDKNKNSMTYVCFNKDLQIRSLIVYWLKYYIKYSYSKNGENALKILNNDFNTLKSIVEKYYKFENNFSNEIEKQYLLRFNLLLDIASYNDYEKFKDNFINNNFAKSSKLIANIAENPTKFYILGGSGAGKSYVSNLINENLKLDVISLDKIYWKDNFSSPNDTTFIVDKINELTSSKRGYIIEGSYLDDWVFEAFKKCDKVFFLKVDYKLQKKRILSRFIKRKLKIEKCSKKESIKSIKNLLDWSKSYSVELDRFIEKSKKDFSEKIEVVYSSNEILEKILMK